MEIRQLEYFAAICQEKHFTRAAEKLNVTQPTLSHQIKALEDELGVPLFDRIGKKIAITEAGQLLLKHCGQVFNSLSSAREEISELQKIKRGSLAVGALPGELSQLVSSLLLDYHRSHPHILVKVVSSDDVAERILRSELDLAITILPVEDERITEIPLYDEELCLVVSSGHPLAARDEADMDEIRDLPFILFPQNYRCREQMDLACRAEGIHITPVIETDSAMSIINLVEEQAGISILSRTLLNLAHNDKIKILKLNAPALHRKIGVIHHRDRYTGFAAREFIELLHRGAEVSSLPDRTIPTSTEL